jgi:undecaprenyl pyrophosphate phosphatase UppP
MAKKEADREIIHLELEKSRIEREKARIVLNMGLVLYFGFLVAGIIGFAFEFINSSLLNVIVVCGIFVLVISTAPYLIIVHREEKWIKKKEREIR